MKSQTFPRVLHKGVHILSFPLNKSLSIEEIFPKEIGGSSIEWLNGEGVFTDKEAVYYEHGHFKVSDTYKILHPLQIIRLSLKRDITLNWEFNIHFRNHSRLHKEVFPYASAYSKEKALYLMQLCKLTYYDEERIKETLQRHYDFNDVFYFSKSSAHQRFVKKDYLKLFYLFFKSTNNGR